MKRLGASAVPLVLLAFGCGTTDPGGPPPRITALPRALTSQEQRLIEADNRFAIKLLRQVTAATRDTLENLFISPLSVAMALGMTYNGAAGTTEEAMRATLELEGMTRAEVNTAYHDLIAMLRGLDPGVRFTIANSIWYREEYTFEQTFLDTVRTSYDARVEALDFSAPGAATTINDWVSQATSGLIRDIVPSPIPQDEWMYLINAIYFKGDWTQQFDRARTQNRPFHRSDGAIVSVPSMTHGREVTVRAHRDAAVQVLDLPYAGQAFTMTVVLPHEPATIDDFVASLTSEAWNTWIAALDSTRSHVYLPKFRLENDLALIPTLGALGMGIAFGDFADFSRMYAPPPTLVITSVKHKTYVNVDEEGTEAAAATAVGVGPTSLPPTIEIDRPFVFALRENLSGTILFMGVIRHPTTE